MGGLGSDGIGCVGTVISTALLLARLHYADHGLNLLGRAGMDPDGLGLASLGSVGKVGQCLASLGWDWLI